MRFVLAVRGKSPNPEAFGFKDGGDMSQDFLPKGKNRS
jgi:hypothetical protein